MENIDQTRAKLSKYLYSITRYKETYEEIYDHILKTIEHQNQPYEQNLVDKIINDEFGGQFGINNLEGEVVLATKTKLDKAYWMEFSRHFTKLNLIYTLAIFGMWFFLAKKDVSSQSILVPFYTAIVAIWAGTIICLVLIKMFNRFRRKKTSIFTESLFKSCIKNNSTIAFSATFIIIVKYFLPFSHIILSIIVAVLFTLISINVRVFRKLNSHEAHLKTT